MKIFPLIIPLFLIGCGTTLMYHTNVQHKLKDSRKGVMLEKNSPDLPSKSEAVIYAGEDVWIYDANNKSVFNKASNGYLVIAPGEYRFEAFYYHLNKRSSNPIYLSIKLKPYQTAIICKNLININSVELVEFKTKIFEGFIYEIEEKTQHCRDTTDS